MDDLRMTSNTVIDFWCFIMTWDCDGQLPIMNIPRNCFFCGKDSYSILQYMPLLPPFCRCWIVTQPALLVSIRIVLFLFASRSSASWIASIVLWISAFCSTETFIFPSSISSCSQKANWAAFPGLESVWASISFCNSLILEIVSNFLLKYCLNLSNKASVFTLTCTTRLMVFLCRFLHVTDWLY